MLSECAVAPEALAGLRTRNELLLLMSVVAFDRSVRPCGIPNKATWIEQTVEALKKACPESLSARQCIPDVIRRLKNLAIERAPSPVVDPHAPWPTAALAADAERPFHCVVAPSGEPSSASRMKSMEDFFSEHQDRHANFEVERDPVILAGVLGSFFHWSEKIIIVDPYGMPGSGRGRQGLNETLRCLAQRATQRRPAEFLIVCEPRFDGTTPSLAQLKRAATEELKVLAPLGIARTWRFIVERVHLKWAMHDRFLLTKIGGVLSGAGFDRGRGKTTISLLGEGLLGDKLREFGAELGRYAKFEDVVVRDP